MRAYRHVLSEDARHPDNHKILSGLLPTLPIICSLLHTGKALGTQYTLTTWPLYAQLYKNMAYIWCREGSRYNATQYTLTTWPPYAQLYKNIYISVHIMYTLFYTLYKCIHYSICTRPYLAQKDIQKHIFSTSTKLFCTSDNLYRLLQGLSAGTELFSCAIWRAAPCVP